MSLPAHHQRKIGSGFRRPDPTGGAVAPSHSDRPARFTPHADPAGNTSDSRAPVPSGWVRMIGLGGLAFTAGAVILEVISGQYANSAVPGWARWVPSPGRNRCGWRGGWRWRPGRPGSAGRCTASGSGQAGW